MIDRQTEWFCYHITSGGLVTTAQCRELAKALTKSGTELTIGSLARAIVEKGLCTGTEQLERLGDLGDLAIEEASRQDPPPVDVVGSTALGKFRSALGPALGKRIGAIAVLLMLLVVGVVAFHGIRKRHTGTSAGDTSATSDGTQAASPLRQTSPTAMPVADSHGRRLDPMGPTPDAAGPLATSPSTPSATATQGGALSAEREPYPLSKGAIIRLTQTVTAHVLNPEDLTGEMRDEVHPIPVGTVMGITFVRLAGGPSEARRAWYKADVRGTSLWMAEADIEGKYEVIHSAAETLRAEQERQAQERAEQERLRQEVQAQQEQRRRAESAREEQKAKQEAERLVEQRGPKPGNSQFDGSVACVKDYLSGTLNDADSVKYVEWSEAIEHEGYWAVRCKFRAKNRLGAYILVNWLFLIQGSKVVEHVDLE